MNPQVYSWTDYWDGALQKGQGSLPKCILRLMEAARDNDRHCFAVEARALPHLELAVAYMVFQRVEELHRMESKLVPVADAIASLVAMLVSEEAQRNFA